jgi:hypothetical protein
MKQKVEHSTRYKTNVYVSGGGECPLALRTAWSLVLPHP